MSDTKQKIMSAARRTVQAHGYSGLSFRELAKEVGIKSASIHHHFPTKGDLGAAVARRYWEDAAAGLEALLAESSDSAEALRHYPLTFRKALENDNRLCLCSFMAAEYEQRIEQFYCHRGLDRSARIVAFLKFKSSAAAFLSCCRAGSYDFCLKLRQVFEGFPE